MTLILKWLKESRGVTAVEFALVAMPFILMVIGTIEIAMMSTAQSLLQESTFTASRLIRTGQIQTGGGDPKQAFRDAVCGFASLLIPCSSIQFQVEKLDQFGDAEGMPPPEFDKDGNLKDQTFDPGGVSDVVLIRVVYNYPIITPLMQPLLSTYGNDKYTMMSTIVLQSEPYKFEEE